MSIITSFNKSEEIQKWRRQQMNSNGEPQVSPAGILSRCRNFPTNFYVTLAKESPKRANIDDESDASTYDSFHCRETDICKDSSDTDSNSSFTTDGIATMEVVEYEVASTSAAEDLYSNDSSSGTDELLLAVATSAMCQTSSDCSSDFADTEQSSSDFGNSDSELSSADYWSCVKCKNVNNNPMFRYCEKCYQIRKTHFPPRPRLRKTRSVQKQKSLPLRLAALRNTVSSPNLDNFQRDKQKNDEISKRLGNFETGKSMSSNRYKNSKLWSSRGKRNYNKKRRLSYIDTLVSQLNSAADTSSDNSERDQRNFYNKKEFKDNVFGISSSCSERKQLKNSSTKKSSSLIIGKQSANINLKSDRLIDRVQVANLKRKFSDFGGEEEADGVSCSKKPLNQMPSGDIIFSDSETDVVVDHLGIKSQKDSGFSSAPSSQEFDIPLSTLAVMKAVNLKMTNDNDDDADADTVCEELDENEIAEISKEFCDNGKISPVDSIAESSSAITNGSAISETESKISNSDLFLSPKSKSPLKSNQKNSDNSDYAGYGSCMTCLSEPKNGVFVHSRFLHLCCCYKCAVKIWNKSKKCPICNCAVKNVMKLFIH